MQKQIGIDPNTLLPPQTELTTPKPKAPVGNNSPTVIRNEDTGDLTGVTFPDGRSFVGLSPRDVRALINANKMRTELPQGAQEAATPNQVIKNNPEIEKQLATIGQVQTPQASNETAAAIKGATPDVLQNIAAKTAAGAATGAISGGVLGSIVPVAGTSVGAAGGAILGGAAGLVTGLFTAIPEIRSEMEQQSAKQLAGYTQAEKNLKMIIKEAADGYDPTSAIEAYNYEIEKIYQYEANLKALDESMWEAKAKPELEKIQGFRDRKGLYDMGLAEAIIKGKEANLSALNDGYAYGETQ